MVRLGVLLGKKINFGPYTNDVITGLSATKTEMAVALAAAEEGGDREKIKKAKLALDLSSADLTKGIEYRLSARGKFSSLGPAG